MRLDATGAHCLRDQRDRARPGHRGHDGAVRRDRASACRSSGARHHRRHRRDALWRRHLGVARRRHRRRDAHGRPARRCATTCWRSRARSCRPAPTGSTSPTASMVDAGTRSSGSDLAEWRASSISAPTRCRRACRPNWSRRATMCRAASLRLHQRHAGVSYLEVDTETGFVRLLEHWWSRIAARDQPAAGRRADPRRRRAGSRRGAVRALPSTMSAGQLLNGTMADYLVPMAGEMPDIDVAHVVSPTARFRARRQGRRRGGHRRRAGGVDERRQRCAAAARRRSPKSRSRRKPCCARSTRSRNQRETTYEHHRRQKGDRRGDQKLKN